MASKTVWASGLNIIRQIKSMNNTNNSIQHPEGNGNQANEWIRKISALNDFFRKNFIGGKVVLTSGVSRLDEETCNKVLNSVKDFNSFTKDNDPYGEHDFGIVVVKGVGYYWKIDYYDSAFEMHSPDESDPEVTQRVLTIMRKDEY
jgi:hypothetical protein